jgi:hypothetical protein
MTAGTASYMGLAIPLYGGATMESRSTSIDILTMDLASGGSEDFLVFRTNAGSELSFFDSRGSFNAVGAANGNGLVFAKTGTGQTNFARIRLPILATAPASAGLTKGDIWLAKASTDTYRMALCVSTAAGTVNYDAILNRVTLGTVSH